MRSAAAAIADWRPLRVVPSLSPRLRLRLALLVAVCLLLVAGYQFWLRDSSLVAVDDVKVSGLTTKDAERIRRALEIAGQSMTTLHVREERLLQAVSAFPVVRDIEVTADFPHGLSVRVIEHHPAGIVEVGGRELPVAGDGTVLLGMPLDRGLPHIEGRGGVAGDRLEGAELLHAARIAGAAPAPLRSRIETIGFRADQGIVAELSEGPELIFGDASRAEAKWIAAARVLADPAAEGATYIDLRLPGRPAAGGLPAATVAPVAPAEQTAVTPPAAATADPAAAATDPAQVPATTDPQAATETPATPVPEVPSTPVTPAPAAPTTPETTAPAGGVAAPPG